MPSQPTVAVVGLGYVGLPIAVYFGRVLKTIGLDINSRRVAELRQGRDRNRDLPDGELKNSGVEFSEDFSRLGEADFIIVTVPTPVDTANRPDLRPVSMASETVGKHMRKGSIVIFESTVYPGCTEEVCLPILEKASGLKGGADFKIGYSPERINPGDHDHTFTKITKVVSGEDADTLEKVATLYERVVTAGVHRAASIKVAEAAKVIENTQRDLNIALINELSLIFHRVGIDTQDVLAAAGTKWNFLRFQPGLVGGHCIGVDPYYLTHKSEELGYMPQVILSGRRINDGMGAWVAQETLRLLLSDGRARFGSGKPVVTVLGLTFKENVSDLRNSKVIDVIQELERFGIEVQVSDACAYPDEAEHEYGVKLRPLDALKPAHAVVLAVAHDTYREGGWALVAGLLEGGQGVVSDLKNVLPREVKPAEIALWRL